MIKLSTKIVSSLTALLFTPLFDCESKTQNDSDIPNPMKEYRWNITESAPEEFMIQIVSGFFEAADGYKKGVPTRASVNKGWGSGRSWVVSGRENMPLPKRFELTWFSWRKNTFYHANFDLPFERLQQIVELDNRIPYSLAERPGNIFTLGLAPGGFMVVWLSSGQHNWEVFRGQAIEVEGVPWKAITENEDYTREEYVKLVQTEDFTEYEDSPFFNDPDYWKRLHNEVYNYDIVIDSEYTPYHIAGAFINGERHKYYSEAQNWKAAPLAILEEIFFDFFFPEEKRSVKIYDINRDELSMAFRDLSREDSGVLQVVIKIEGSLLGWEFEPILMIKNTKRAIKIKDFKFDRFGKNANMREIKESKELMRYMNYPNKPAQP